MFYIVETDEQLTTFENHRFDEAFLYVIPLNANYHPKLTGLSLIYVRPFSSHKGYMLCINTDESFCLDRNRVLDVLSKFSKLYVMDKKEALYHLPFEPSLYDIQLTQQIELPSIPSVKMSYYHHADRADVNKLIPISKHYEYCEELYQLIDFNNDNFATKWYKFYNTYVIPTFYLIEQNGITTDIEKMRYHFKPDNLSYSTTETTTYTRYNLYNITSRPSNAFNGINFGALTKDNGCRSSFIAKNDALMEMDFDSFHVRLLGELVGFDFGKDNIHEFLGKQYFNTTELTKEQYKQSKETTFKTLYTEKKLEEYQHIEFFRLVKEYKNKKWDEYNTKGYINGHISDKPLTGITSKTKLLPYILQNYETELNTVKMYKILRLLNGKNTKLVFYNYDAIVLDVDKSEGKELLVKIKSILEKGGYPVSIKFNKTYDFV
jgi:hypothetical protein